MKNITGFFTPFFYLVGWVGIGLFVQGVFYGYYGTFLIADNLVFVAGWFVVFLILWREYVK